MSVCNALDCLLFHAARLADLPQLCAPLAEKRVTIYADAPAFVALQGSYPDALLQPATPEHYGTEFLDYKMAIRTVSSLEEALQQIQRVWSRGRDWHQYAKTPCPWPDGPGGDYHLQVDH